MPATELKTAKDRLRPHVLALLEAHSLETASQGFGPMDLELVHQLAEYIGVVICDLCLSPGNVASGSTQRDIDLEDGYGIKHLTICLDCNDAVNDSAADSTE